jgi:hypothetical protein
VSGRGGVLERVTRVIENCNLTLRMEYGMKRKEGESGARAVQFLTDDKIVRTETLVEINMGNSRLFPVA